MRTSKSTLQVTINHFPKGRKEALKEAGHYALGGPCSPRLRALATIILGRGTHGPSAKGTRAKELIKLIKSCSAASEKSLRTQLYSNLNMSTNFTDEAAGTFMGALLHDPDSTLPSTVCKEYLDRTCLLGALDKLPKHLEKISLDEELKTKSMLDVPGTPIYNSFGNSHHPFYPSGRTTKYYECNSTA